MNIYLIFLLLNCVYGCSVVEIMQELKQNILNFGYGVNFKYEGMLSHSFDRFYAMSKFELHKMEDLGFTAVQFDSKCSYLNAEKVNKDDVVASYLPKVLVYCEVIVPYDVNFYKKQIASYNHTPYEMLTNKIGMILPTFPKEKRHKRSIIGSIISGLIGLAYEGISSFLHHKCQKALKKAVTVMEIKAYIQQYKIHHLEDYEYVWHL